MFTEDDFESGTLGQKNPDFFVNPFGFQFDAFKSISWASKNPDFFFRETTYLVFSSTHFYQSLGLKSPDFFRETI